MKNRNLFYIALIVTMIFSPITMATDVTIGIKEKLGQSIPLNLEFTNEEGKVVQLKELFDKPVILTLVYYRCPGICTPLLNELQTVVDKVNLEPGKDFRIITVSIDPNETHETALEKKKNYLNLMKQKKNFPADAWNFFVGNDENITKLAEAVGFRYQPDKNEFRHAGALIVVSPEGKIARYLYGLQYLPLDVQMAVVEASEGRVGPTIAKVLKYCFSYDPVNKKYVLNIVSISGVVIVFFLSIFASFIIFSKKIQPSQRLIGNTNTNHEDKS